MPINKHAFIRYKVLDNCFRNNGRRYYFSDLQKAVNEALKEIDPDSRGVSRRTLYEDFNFMESAEGWSASIIRYKDGVKVYYRYEDLDFSINNMPLNETEVRHLSSAIEILSQFKGMPQFEWVQEMIPKLNNGIKTIKESNQAIIEFESNSDLKGIEYIETLYNSISYEKVLEITYQPFLSKEVFVYTIHPYYLKQFNNRWFLFGYNNDLKKYDWNLALDRIVQIKESKLVYHKNKKIVWQDYFEDFYGVTRPESGKLEKVVLHFYGKTAYYINSKPIFVTQKKPKFITADVLEVKLELMINFEFERLILSYANNVKVISPQHLADKIKNALRDGYGLYE